MLASNAVFFLSTSSALALETLGAPQALPAKKLQTKTRLRPGESFTEIGTLW
jgi:hypothetical protein